MIDSRYAVKIPLEGKSVKVHASGREEGVTSLEAKN